MNNSTKALIVIALACGIAALFLSATKQVPSINLGGGDEVLFTRVASSSVNVATTSTLLLDVNTARKYVTCSNRGPATVWLAMNNTTASKGWGFALWASSSWTMEQGKGMWFGRVYALSNGATQKVTCIEGY